MKRKINTLLNIYRSILLLKMHMLDFLCFVTKQNNFFSALQPMPNKNEKYFRLIPYTVFAYLAVVPGVSYIAKEPSMCSKFTLYFVAITATLGALYATIAILQKGYAEKHVPLQIPEDLEKKCNFCNIIKPERSHHCKLCNKCILKMDHHCNILSVCINNQNHGHFIRFIFFMWLSSTWMLLYSIILVGFKLFHKKHKIGYGRGFAILITIFISIFVTLITSMHLYWQGLNLKRNITNIEVVQEHNSKYRDINCGDSPYNFGLYSNIKDVFGKPAMLFLGPPTTDGYNWKKNHRTYYWPLIDKKNINEIDDEDI